MTRFAFLDGYFSTVQGLLDWFEVDLGFTELLFIQIDLCVKDDSLCWDRQREREGRKGEEKETKGKGGEREEGGKSGREGKERERERERKRE